MAAPGKKQLYEIVRVYCSECGHAKGEKKKRAGRCYPCRLCGQYPEWGSGFLVCPNDCYETDYNHPLGTSVRQWNRRNKPGGGG